MANKNNIIPQYVINWTDKYFHQSAFDIPVSFPDNKIITFLCKFKKSKRIALFRGINKFNKDNFTNIESWTHDIKVAKRYAKESRGRIIKKFFNPKNILLDTTLLSQEEKNKLGYDYKIDDKEVLIINNPAI